MFTPMPSLEEDGLHSLSSKTASSAAVGTYGRFDGERSRSGGSIGRRKQDSQRRCKLRVILSPPCLPVACWLLQCCSAACVLVPFGTLMGHGLWTVFVRRV